MDDAQKSLSIDIDTATLTQNLDKAKASVSALTDEINKLKTAGKDTGDGFDKLAGQLKAVEDKLKDDTKAATDLKDALTNAWKAQVNLTQAQATSAQAQANNTSTQSAAAAQKKLQDAITSTLKLMNDLDIKYRNAGSAGKNEEIEKLTIAYNNLSVAERQNVNLGVILETRIAGLRAAQHGTTIDQDNLNNSIRNGSDLFVIHKNIIDTAAGSISNTKMAILTLTHEYFNLSEAQRNNADIGGKLNTQIASLQANLQNLESKSISDLSKNLVDASKKIFPFSEGIGQAAEHFESLKKGLSGIKDLGKSFTEYRDAVKALTAEQNLLQGSTNSTNKYIQLFKSGLSVATGGVGNFTKALAATGLGLIIISVGLLIDYLKKFQPVVDFTERVIAGFTGALAAGKHVLDEFFGSINSVGDAFSKIWQVMKHPIDAFGNLTKTMKDAGLQMIALTKMQQEVDSAVAATASRNAERETQMARLRLKMLTDNATQKKQHEKELKQLEENSYNETKRNTEKLIALALGKVNIVNKLTGDEILDINNLSEAKIKELEETKHLDEATVKSLRETLKQREALRAQYIAKVTKETQDIQAKDAETKSKSTAAESKHSQDLKVIHDSRNRVALEKLKDGQEKELAELKISFEEQKKEYKNNTKVLVQLTIEHNEAIKKVKEKYAADEKNKALADDKALFDAEQQTKILLAKDDFELVHALKKELNKKDLEFELKNITLSETAKKTLREQYKQKEFTEEQEYSDIKKSALEKLIEEDKKSSEAEKDPGKKFKAEIKLLDDQYALELLMAKDNKAKQLEIEKKHVDDLSQLKAKENANTANLAKGEGKVIDTKLAKYKGYFSTVQGLLGKHTAASKAAFLAEKAIAIAEIIIGTQKEIKAIALGTAKKVVNDTAYGPFAGPAMAAIDTALGLADTTKAIIGGALQVGVVASTAVQGFARGGLYKSDGYGGYLTGPGTGTSDSINARLSNGESIINARSTEMFAPILSAINQAGGGRAFNAGNAGNGYALGGMFNGSNSLNDSSTELAQTRAMNDMAKTLAANMPRQILVVEDVQASLQNRAMLQNMSNF